MLRQRRQLALFATMVLGSGVVGVAVAANGSSDPVAPVETPVRCEIQVTHQAGLTTLTGVVEATVPSGGSYRFLVAGIEGSGGSDIRQSGTFTVLPDEAAMLGRVTLSGENYNARLEVTSNGRVISCSQPIAGWI